MTLTYNLRCGICGCLLNDPHNMRETLDCGGDCVKCMADSGDPEAVDVMTTLHSLTEQAVESVKETWNVLNAKFNPEHPDANESGWYLPPTPDWIKLLERTAWPNNWTRPRKKRA